MLIAEENAIEKAKTTCTYRFGFYADIRKNKWENAKEQLGKKLIQQYFSRIENKATHNLCTYLTPPKNVKNLLGLGLTFCVQPKHPKDNFSESFERFKYDVRTKYRLKIVTKTTTTKRRSTSSQITGTHLTHAEKLKKI